MPKVYHLRRQAEHPVTVQNPTWQGLARHSPCVSFGGSACEFFCGSSMPMTSGLRRLMAGACVKLSSFSVASVAGYALGIPAIFAVRYRRYATNKREI